LVKDSKLKVQASIQEQAVRISGKKRDELQLMIQRLRAADDLDLDLQFINFRE
jgi:cyclic-di-GMP-binding protein